MKSTGETSVSIPAKKRQIIANLSEAEHATIREANRIRQAESRARLHSKKFCDKTGNYFHKT